MWKGPSPTKDSTWDRVLPGLYQRKFVDREMDLGKDNNGRVRDDPPLLFPFNYVKGWMSVDVKQNGNHQSYFGCWDRSPRKSPL